MSFQEVSPEAAEKHQGGDMELKKTTKQNTEATIEEIEANKKNRKKEGERASLSWRAPLNQITAIRNQEAEITKPLGRHSNRMPDRRCEQNSKK